MNEEEIKQQLHATYRMNEQICEDMGYEHKSYETWLESRVVFWEKCARARYREGQYSYTEQDIIDNLQATVNQQQARIVELERLLNNRPCA